MHIIFGIFVVLIVLMITPGTRLFGVMVFATMVTYILGKFVASSLDIHFAFGIALVVSLPLLIAAVGILVVRTNVKAVADIKNAVFNDPEMNVESAISFSASNKSGKNWGGESRVPLYTLMNSKRVRDADEVIVKTSSGRTLKFNQLNGKFISVELESRLTNR